MKNQSCYTILFFLLSFHAGHSLSAQKTIVIKSNLDKTNIVIGEQLHLNLEADFPSHEPVSFFVIDSIPHFEILDRKKIDTLDNPDVMKLSETITLTSFDSGHWVIPSFELPGNNGVLTDSFAVNVSFSPFDPNQDYHDIKDVVDVHVTEKKKQNLYVFVGITLVVISAIFYLLVRKRKPPLQPIIPQDAYAEANQELEKLKKENPAPKIFFTRLVDIFRLYISRQKGLASLQETTDDLVFQLRSLKLPADDFSRLAQALRMSDFV